MINISKQLYTEKTKMKECKICEANSLLNYLLKASETSMSNQTVKMMTSIKRLKYYSSQSHIQYYYSPDSEKEFILLKDSRIMMLTKDSRYKYETKKNIRIFDKKELKNELNIREYNFVMRKLEVETE